MPGLEVQREQLGSRTILRVSDELDFSNVDDLREQIETDIPVEIRESMASVGLFHILGDLFPENRAVRTLCSNPARAGVVIVGSGRGGEVEAGGDVVVGELGSQAGVKTSVKVPPGSKVTARLVWEHVRVQVGHQAHRFDRQARNVRLSLDREGKLRLSRVRRLAAW